MKHSKIIERMLADKGFIQDQDLSDQHWAKTRYTKHMSIATILKDRAFLEKNKEATEDLVDSYLEYLEETSALKPRPLSKTNYVGIELECFTRYSRPELLEKIVDQELEKIVQPVTDGSINASFGEDCELRILLPEKDLVSGLKKVGKLLTKGKFGVNSSCGLHIHLDMRNRDVNACYERLLQFQDILFGMVKRERWDNTYCQYTKKDNTWNRYVAINKDVSYANHKTIEIRLHHATLDMKRIEQWVKLLLRVINTKAPPPKETRADVIKWGRKQKGLGLYLAKNFDENWFEEKKVAIGT